jgi:uncharacterized protein YbjT (DUF2867 family)
MARRQTVIGALGGSGRALVERLTADPDWEVIALSRRTPDLENSARYISVDLEPGEPQGPTHRSQNLKGSCK